MPVSPLPSLRSLASAAAALVLLCPACASKPGAGGPGAYRGVVVTGSEIGILDVVVGEAAGSPFPANAALTFPGRVVSLSGTLDQPKTMLSLSSSTGYQLVGQSRTKYVFGSYAGPTGAQDGGSFALFLVPPDGTPVERFCGSFVATTATGSTLPFAVTAVVPGPAICVGPNFTWFGSLDADDNLFCSISGGEFEGNVNADAGNPWGTGQNYGTWAVVPCGNSSTDGGVVAEGDADSATTADVNHVADAGVNSPADLAANTNI